MVEMRRLGDARVRVHVESAAWCGGELLEHVGVLDILSALNDPILTQLEEEVLRLVHGERVVIPTEEVADLSLLDSNLGRWPLARIHVCTMHPVLGGLHVVFVSALQRRSVEHARPPAEA